MTDPARFPSLSKTIIIPHHHQHKVPISNQSKRRTHLKQIAIVIVIAATVTITIARGDGVVLYLACDEVAAAAVARESDGLLSPLGTGDSGRRHQVRVRNSVPCSLDAKRWCQRLCCGEEERRMLHLFLPLLRCRGREKEEAHKKPKLQRQKSCV